jgi:hypothetical protein
MDEIFLDVLTKIGGATVVIGGLAALLGKLWLDRQAKTLTAKFDADMEQLKSSNVKALEDFRASAAFALKEREFFSELSSDFYKGFFAKRVEVYQELLRLANDYIVQMDEDFLAEELEAHGERHVRSYKVFRACILENQIYVSNGLEKAFRELRAAISPILLRADRDEAWVHGLNGDLEDVLNARRDHEQNALRLTHDLMTKMLDQLTRDVSKMRSRIDMD